MPDDAVLHWRLEAGSLSASGHPEFSNLPWARELVGNSHGQLTRREGTPDWCMQRHQVLFLILALCIHHFPTCSSSQFPRQIVVWRQESRFKYFKFGHNSTKREASTSNNLLARRFCLHGNAAKFQKGKYAVIKSESDIRRQCFDIYTIISLYRNNVSLIN